MQRGAKKQESNNTTFMSVAKGQFVKRVKEPTAKSIARILEKGVNKGKEVHEEYYDQIIGAIVGIDIEKHDEYGKFWRFKLDVSKDENDEFIILTLKYSSGYANNLLTRLPNINYSRDVMLKGYNFQPKDKDKPLMGISIFQDDDAQNLTKIEPYFTKETPHGLPEMKKIKVKGQEVWDDTERLEAFEELIQSDILPKIALGQGLNDKTQPVEILEPDAITSEDEKSKDELPF